MSTKKQSIDAINRAMATEINYEPTKLDIKKTDDETRNVISNTFGQFIKNNLAAFWSEACQGFSPNVTKAYESVMTNPNECIELNGKKFYPHPGVGNLRAYNEAGNPSGGCFTMTAMA
jgi:hypothetical protein